MRQPQQCPATGTDRRDPIGQAEPSAEALVREGKVEGLCHPDGRVFGVFQDDPEFEAAMRLGRAYRESLRPRDDEAAGESG